MGWGAGNVFFLLVLFLFVNVVHRGPYGPPSSSNRALSGPITTRGRSVQVQLLLEGGLGSNYYLREVRTRILKDIYSQSCAF